MATTTSLTNLDSAYQALINYQIQVESQPLTRLNTQKTQLQTQRAVYADLKTKLDQLRSAAKTLLSTDTFFSLKEGRQISISGVATGTTVLSGSVSYSAVPASYTISDIILAKNDQIRSDMQEYADQALGKTGTFFIGGKETSSLEKLFENLASVGVGSVEAGQEELSTGSYFVETRLSGENWQFRVVDASGAAVSIKNGEGYSADWQAIPAGAETFDTGRGLSLTFGADAAKYFTATRTSGAAKLTYDSELDTATKMSAVTSVVVNDEIETGQKELGSGSYFVETRLNSENVWQFRLVNSEGKAISIKDGSNYSSSWQTIPTDSETYSTGRGISIDFGTDADLFVANSKATGAYAIDYAAKGAEIEVTSSMSLVDIASAINSGAYGEGNELTATVVNKQLVIHTNYTGANHRLEASGTVLEELGILNGTAFKNVIQSASDASFKVNGLSVTRSQNSALTDVINGVTLNLAADAEGKSATVNITSDNSAAKTAINSFISSFNGLQTYLTGKLATTKQADGTYTRGSLAGEFAISSLRNDLYSKITRYDASGGLYKSIREIGIDINSSMSISITDSSKLDAALKNNYSEVTDLLDRIMGDIETQLSKYTGSTSSYVSQLISSNESLAKTTEEQIKNMNSRLDKRKVALTEQYAEIQAQMTLLSYTQQTNTAWINSLSGLYS